MAFHISSNIYMSIHISIDINTSIRVHTARWWIGTAAEGTKLGNVRGCSVACAIPVVCMIYGWCMDDVCMMAWLRNRGVSQEHIHTCI